MSFAVEGALVSVVSACGLWALGMLSKSGIGNVRVRLNRFRISRAKTLIDHMYSEDMDPYHLSMQYREKNKISGDEYTYGEIFVPSFAELLRLADPKPNEVFYDLGCGAGKAVFTAALCFPSLKVRGVELLPPLYNLCKDTQQHFNQQIKKESLFRKNTFDIEFINDNLLQHDFSDGHIFFLNATCFREKDWNKLQKKLLDCREHTRFIIVTRQFDNDCVELLQSGTYRMSWGPSSVYIYRKI